MQPSLAINNVLPIHALGTELEENIMQNASRIITWDNRKSVRKNKTLIQALADTREHLYIAEGDSHTDEEIDELIDKQIAIERPLSTTFATCIEDVILQLEMANEGCSMAVGCKPNDLLVLEGDGRSDRINVQAIRTALSYLKSLQEKETGPDTATLSPLPLKQESMHDSVAEYAKEFKTLDKAIDVADEEMNRPVCNALLEQSRALIESIATTPACSMDGIFAQIKIFGDTDDEEADRRFKIIEAGLKNLQPIPAPAIAVSRLDDPVIELYSKLQQLESQCIEMGEELLELEKMIRPEARTIYKPYLKLESERENKWNEYMEVYKTLRSTVASTLDGILCQVKALSNVDGEYDGQFIKIISQSIEGMIAKIKTIH